LSIGLVAENLDRPGNPGTRAPAETWLTVSDALLRGLNHALSNRAATVGAVSGVLDPAEPPSEVIVQVLRDEAQRLDELLQLARMLPGQRGAVAEPVHLPDVVPAAVALHTHHFDLRDTLCRVDDSATTVMPVLADPTALSHALLLLLTAAKRSAAGAEVLLWHRGDGERVTLTLECARATESDEHDRELTAAAAAMLLASDGSATRLAGAGGTDGGARYELTLPTLAAARRAERARNVGLAPSERRDR
jgi:signal transduction histidine kinase